MEEKAISFSVKLELRDYLNSARLSHEKWTYGYLGFIFTAILGLITVNDVLGIIKLLIIYAILFIFQILSYKKQFKSNKLARKDVVYNFTINGIETLNADGSGNSNIQWDELYGAKQNKDVILLMTGYSTGRIIPKRQLNTTQITDLEALIKNKLGIKAFKKVNYFKYVCIGVLVFILTLYLPETLNLINQCLRGEYSVIYLILKLMETILFFLMIGLGIFSIIQFCRWVYGLFISKLRISFTKVIIPFLASIFMTFLFYTVWNFNQH